ncbi:MAG: protein kinase, partial [gamma proteobacterium symbiont of Lucinoma myriamae]|nr:protein kinase [gamma proteobacterium symbiont of Lucinoma myriamae]
ISPQETILASIENINKEPSSPQETQLAPPAQLSPVKTPTRLNNQLSSPQETHLAQSSCLSVEQNHSIQKNAEPNKIQQTQGSTFSTISTIISLGSEHFSSELISDEQTVHDWRIGEVLLELYEVKSLLGEGQFGKVFQVRHRDWNIDLAVKTPKQKALSAGSENIEKEAETWVNLDLHPNIVNCYYVRRIDGIPQIISEYVDGGDLKQLIASQQLYQEGEHKALLRVLDISIQFAWGLDYAHEQGLIHQDIKPANVMVTSSGVIKVTDFGLAKAGALANFTEQNSKQTIIINGMGMTPAYASPEQFSGRHLTRRTDVWSWAVCVLEMILDYCSWEAGTVAPGILEAYNDNLLDDKPKIASIPEALSTLLMQCFEEAEDNRPISLLEVADRLLEIYLNESGEEYPRVQPQEGSGTASSLNNQAISLIDLGQKEEAVKSWKNALNIDPQHFETNYNFLIFQWKNQGLDELELIAKIESFYEKEKNSTKINTNSKRIACALAKLYIQFGYYINAIKILNNDQETITQLPVGLSNEAYKVLGLALCAHYRLVKKSSTWLGAVQCLKKSVVNNATDPYSITAYTLALQRSGQNKLASMFFKTSMSVGIIPRQLKQAVALFLPGYEVLYRIAKKHIDVIKFINNGETILFNQANILIVWSLKEKHIIHEMKGHLSQITAIEVSQDETIVITASEQGDIRVWDIITGRWLNVWTAHKDMINALKISSCGQFLYSASNDNTLCKWDYHNETQINSFYGEGHSNAINDIKLSFSGTQIISAGADNTLRLWDTDTGRTIKIIYGHERAITSVCWLDDRHVISGSEDKTIRLWDVSTAQCLKTFYGHKGLITCLQVAADKGFLLSGSSDGSVRYWNIKTGSSYTISHFMRTVRNITLDESQLFALVVTPSGVSMIETNNPFKYRAASIFSLPESAVEIDQLSRKYHRKIKRAKLALSNHHNVTYMQEIDQARSLKGFERDYNGFKYWSELYAIFPKLKLKDILRYADFSEHTKRITSMDFSPVDNVCYSASKDQYVYQWNIERQQVNKIFSKFDKPISIIKVTNDGQGILIACGNNILVMDIKSDKQLSLFCHHIGDVLAMTITADGRFALSSDDKGKFFLWRLLTGEVIADFTDKATAITTIAVTPDGRFSLTGHRNNYFISVWDMEAGRITSVLEGHDNIVTSIAVTSDGRYFLSASADASLRLWQVESSRKKSIQVMKGHAKRINQVSVDFQNKLAISASDDKTIKIWDLVNGNCLHTFENTNTMYTTAIISMNAQYALSGDSGGNIVVWCLDWFLNKKNYHEWDADADIYLKNYVSTHKTIKPHKELKKMFRILQYAGYGWLDRNDVGLKLVDFYQLNTSTILPASKLTRVSRNEKQNSFKKKILLYTLLSVMVISGLITFFQKNNDDFVQDNKPEQLIITDENVLLTIDNMRDIAVLLAEKNSDAVIYKNRIDVRSLVVFENSRELTRELNLSSSDLFDAWGNELKYKGIKVGAFQGRIVLRSAGTDQKFKTEDDILLNGFPHWNSLSIRKNNDLIMTLSSYKKSIENKENSDTAGSEGSEYSVYDNDNISDVQQNESNHDDIELNESKDNIYDEQGESSDVFENLEVEEGYEVKIKPDKIIIE